MVMPPSKTHFPLPFVLSGAPLKGVGLTTDRPVRCLDTWSFVESLTHRMAWIGNLLEDYLVPVPLSWKPMEGYPPATSQKERLQKLEALPFPPLTLSFIEPSWKNREQATSTSVYAHSLVGGWLICYHLHLNGFTCIQWFVANFKLRVQMQDETPVTLLMGYKSHSICFLSLYPLTQDQ